MKKKKQIEVWQRRIEKVSKAYQELSDICDKLNACGVMDYEGNLHTTIWRSWEVVLDELDVNGWIAWWIYDADLGAKSLSCTPNKGTKKIKVDSAKKLAKIIVDELADD